MFILLLARCVVVRLRSISRLLDKMLRGSDRKLKRTVYF